MKIQKIEIINYGPFYGKHEFDFSNRGLTLVAGNNLDEPRMDSNGSGKSSIFDALDWGLFGKVPRGDHVDSVINEQAKKDCAVSVSLISDTGANILIERGRGRNTTLSLQVDGVNHTALDIKETQAKIEQILGLDREVFHAAVLFAQTDLQHYADSSDNERMDTLTRILQLEEIDILLESALVKMATHKDSIAKLEMELTKADAIHKNLLAQDFTKLADNWDASHRASMMDFRVVISQKMMEIVNFENTKKSFPDLSVLKARQLEIQGELKALENFYKFPDTDRRIALQLTADRRSAVASKAKELAGLEDKRKGFDTMGLGKCSLCGQEITKEHLVSEVMILDLAIKDAIDELNKAKADQAIALENESKVQASYEAALIQYQDSYRAKSLELNQCEATLLTVTQLEQAIAKAKVEYTNLEILKVTKENEKNPYIALGEEIKGKIELAEKEVGRISGAISAANQEKEYYDFWVDAFRVKGLKSYILDSRLQELTDAVNEWVRILTGGTIWIQFVSQKQTRGSKLVNSPEIKISRWNTDGTITERNYKSWSGGEKQRISFAIDFGLSRLIANRSKQSYDLLILDEVFRHLDQAGKEAVMEMLKLLAMEKSSIIVVEHDTDFKESFEHCVMVEKKNGRSTIKEVA